MKAYSQTITNTLSSKTLLTASSLLVVTLMSGLAEADALRADFNGDNKEDLVVGIPNEDFNGQTNTGAVKVVYGHAAGAMESGSSQTTYLHQARNGAEGIHLSGWAESFDYFGSSLAVGDFNSDGFDDLAIGVKEEAVGNVKKAGLVNIVYGSSNGLVKQNNHMLNLERFISGVHMRANILFGTALTVGDFDNDGVDDLAASYLPTSANRGGVVVFFGDTTSGLKNAEVAAKTILIRDDTDNRTNGFGSALSSGDLSGDGYDELVIGVPYDRVDGIQSGSVKIAYGAANWKESTLYFHTLVSDTRADGDRFGASLTIGNFKDNIGGSIRDELVVGMPYADIAGREESGAVVMFARENTFPYSQNKYFQSQSTIPGTSETKDHFGSALTTADLDNDGVDDLAIGIPGEDYERWWTTDIIAAGAVVVISGSTNITFPYKGELWHQDSPGVAGVREAWDQFGFSLSAGDFNNDGIADLLVGAYNEALGSTEGVGVVQLIWGHHSGLTTNMPGQQMFHQGSFSGAGFGAAENESYDRFSESLLP